MGCRPRRQGHHRLAGARHHDRRDRMTACARSRQLALLLSMKD
jgi:hypothetical protein